MTAKLMYGISWNVLICRTASATRVMQWQSHNPLQHQENYCCSFITIQERCWYCLWGSVWQWWQTIIRPYKNRPLIRINTSTSNQHGPKEAWPATISPRERLTESGGDKRKRDQRKRNREREDLFWYLLVLGIFKALERPKEHKGETTWWGWLLTTQLSSNISQ